ncbi:hypothetical protein DBR06_SOUSAS110092, partial [Sousa chinensis]
ENKSSYLGNEDENYKPRTPGTPAFHDLETTLRRLSVHQENYLLERRFFGQEQDR